MTGSSIVTQLTVVWAVPFIPNGTGARIIYLTAAAGVRLPWHGSLARYVFRMGPIRPRLPRST